MQPDNILKRQTKHVRIIFWPAFYNEGYRTAWEWATGKVDSKVFYDNTKRWSGDHCLAPDRVTGVFFSNFRFAADHPGIVDLAPTILTAFGFGVDPPDILLHGRRLAGSIAGLSENNPSPAIPTAS